ncbi:hypothetical protein LTR67_011238 [Exophiala xenobiotica]
MLADQLLRPLEALRAHYYLHRDIKPKNFLLGSTIGRQGNVFYLTDLSLAVHRRPDQWDYSRIDSRAELPARPPKLLGTCRCASINGHLDVAQSWWDDLEAMGYMLVYFLRGRLPWQRLKAKDDAKYQLVLEQKQTISDSRLCSGLPVEFAEAISYVANSRDSGKPDYHHLWKMFSKLFRRQGFTIREFERLEINKKTSNDLDAN